MDWIKIPTDSILYSEFKDEELIILIKYQALYCQLESEPTEAQMQRIFSKKEIKFLQNYREIVEDFCKNQIKNVSKKRNRDKERYKKKQTLSENFVSETSTKSCRSGVTEKKREDKNIITPLDNKLSIPPTRGKGKKISFSDVVDWESLFTYWEENKKGGKYKNPESRQRMLNKLKELTSDNLNLAKQSICFAIDSGYQGFCNGNELYYRPPKDKPPENLEDKKRREQEEQDRLNRLFGDD